MKIFESIAELSTHLRSNWQVNEPLGLVPTMGAIHEGHLSLVARSLCENDKTVCSIFINPAQFNNPKDLNKYPVQIEKDIELLAASGCDVLFVPPSGEIYNTESPVRLDFGDLELKLEGRFRPGHFAGVGLIVSKLFNIMQPDRAYFGQKDIQQLAVIKKLTDDLNFPIEIIEVETKRDSLGLALSSRNMRLSADERNVASGLYASLNFLKRCIEQEVCFADALARTVEQLKKKSGIALEYLEIVDSRSMAAVSSIEEAKNISACIAAKIGEVRLIDNIYLKKQL